MIKDIEKGFKNGQSFSTNLVVALDYNFTQYFLLDVNFDKSTIRLYFLLIFSILAKFPED